MALPDWTEAGETVTDEVVEFLETEVISSTTYYRGWLRCITNAELADSTQTNSTVYTGAGQTGTRHTVLLAGVPGGATEVMVDISTGKVLATTTTTRYFIYTGFGEHVFPLKAYAYIDQVMPDGTTADWAIRPIPCNMSISRFSWRVDGVAPSGAVVPSAALRTAVSGGGSAQTLTFGNVSDSTRQNKVTQLTAPLVFNTSQSLVVRGDFKGISGLHLYFY